MGVDREARRITVTNGKSYEKKHMVVDLLFLADATTRSGKRTPVAIHLEVMKLGTKLKVDLHRHLRTQERLVDVDFEPFDVIVCGRTMLTPVKVRKLVTKPSLALLLVKAFMAYAENESPCLADLSVGFKIPGWKKWMFARAQVEALSPADSVESLLRDGSWEMRLTALSEKWLPYVVMRDLFLFGLDQQPLLREVKTRGLKIGQTLAFRWERGRGTVGLDGAWEEMPAAPDVVRAYLEFHMLGGLLVEQAQKRITGARTSAARDRRAA